MARHEEGDEDFVVAEVGGFGAWEVVFRGGGGGEEDAALVEGELFVLVAEVGHYGQDAGLVDAGGVVGDGDVGEEEGVEDALAAEDGYGFGGGGGGEGGCVFGFGGCGVEVWDG